MGLNRNERKKEKQNKCAKEEKRQPIYYSHSIRNEKHFIKRAKEMDDKRLSIGNVRNTKIGTISKMV